MSVTFHREVEDLVDMEEIIEEMKQKPKWQFLPKEKEGFKHGVVQAAVGKKPHQCLRSSKRSIYGETSGVCQGLKWNERT